MKIHVSFASYLYVFVFIFFTKIYKNIVILRNQSEALYTKYIKVMLYIYNIYIVMTLYNINIHHFSK